MVSLERGCPGGGGGVVGRGYVHMYECPENDARHPALIPWVSLLQNLKLGCNPRDAPVSAPAALW